VTLIVGGVFLVDERTGSPLKPPRLTAVLVAACEGPWLQSCRSSRHAPLVPDLHDYARRGARRLASWTEEIVALDDKEAIAPRTLLASLPFADDSLFST